MKMCEKVKKGKKEEEAMHIIWKKSLKIKKYKHTLNILYELFAQ